MLNGVLSWMCKINCFDIKINKADLEAPLKISDTYFVKRPVVASKAFLLICLGQNVKALVYRRKQICPLNINTFTLNASISTNEVSMFKLAIEVCFKNNFESIHAIFLSPGSTKSVYSFGTPGTIRVR